MLALQHGEKCGCELLEELNITQPTLSHHMKILADSGLVDYYKDGKWMHYSISAQGVKEFREMIASYARCDCEIDSSVPCGCKNKKHKWYYRQSFWIAYKKLLYIDTFQYVKLMEALFMSKQNSGINTFQRYLSIWVILCMAAGILIGKLTLKLEVFLVNV